MQKTARIVHCPECGQTVIRMIFENILTASCRNCKPAMALLEWLGMTPNQALVLTLLGVGVASLTRD